MSSTYELYDPSYSRGKYRNYITEDEFYRLSQATQETRYALRNRLIIEFLFYHGLRVSELCRLDLLNISLADRSLNVTGPANLGFNHRIDRFRMNSLRMYLKSRKAPLRALFLNERNDRFDRSSINYLLRVLSNKARLPFNANPQMLRHGCGHYRADHDWSAREIQRFLRHKDRRLANIYTRAAARRRHNMEHELELEFALYREMFVKDKI